jgi:hypothetical protein
MSAIDPTLSPEPDLATVPKRVDRATGAKLVTKFYFPVSQRALEEWRQLNWRIVNGRAVCETEALFAEAQARLDAAPLVKPLRKSAAQTPRTAEAA